MEFYVSVPFESLEERMELVSRDGFIPDVRMADTDFLMGLTDSDCNRLKRLLDTRGFRIYSHAPFFGLDVASIDEGISRYSIRCLERAIEVTAALGGALMVMHTGYLPQYSRIGRRYWFGNWSRRMPRLVENARARGVQIALENTWDDRPEVLHHLRNLLPDPGAVAFCLDTGHTNVYSQLAVRRWWRSLGDDIAAIHLHDNDGLSDDHLPPGRGTVDFETLVNLLLECRRPPILELEVDPERAVEGRDYIGALFERMRLERAGRTAAS
ncbi:MAG TPA: sugar phosphate isomerase/epimerase family protein [Patescibacteria group bacterium]|nr:sugar phosphate isomerase/epimerase family protein [Patescibacteria group bacterium]